MGFVELIGMCVRGVRGVQGWQVAGQCRLYAIRVRNVPSNKGRHNYVPKWHSAVSRVSPGRHKYPFCFAMLFIV